jgi:RNA polymerase sigma factor (sigma-70 family)
MTGMIDQPHRTDEDTWLVARKWVAENMRLVHWIAAPYHTYMAADEGDLLQEAILAAFQALTAARKKREEQRFVPFFRVIFRTHCLRLASGIQTVHLANDVLPDACTVEEETPRSEPLPLEIDAALRNLSGRERDICRWILDQDRPVNINQAAEYFHLSRRHISRLLHKGLKHLSEAA